MIEKVIIMKKRFIVWCLCIVLILTSCSVPGSGITIEQVQAECQEHLGDAFPEFEIGDLESGSGKHFSSMHMDSLRSILVSGETDRNGNVTSMILMNQNVNVELLSDEDDLSELLSKDGSEMTMADLRVGYCVIEVLLLCDVVGASDSITAYDVVDVFLEGKSIEHSGWTIFATMAEESVIVTIVANYE